MGSYTGPLFAVLGVTSVFVFLTYLLSRKKVLYGFFPTIFLFFVAVLLFANMILGSKEGFDDMVSLLLGMFFGVCAIITLIFAFLFNRKKIFKNRL
jgi:predicted tellurium resistance membrane protein TerC